MKNLKDYEVQEMDSKEMLKINGGWIGISIAVYLALALYTHENLHK